MLFRVLGATEFPVPLVAAKPRLVALLLLTGGNRPVPLDTLVDEVWPRQPPASAVANIRTYLSQLRKLFPVHSVKELTPSHSIRRELVLIKVAAASRDVRNVISQIANIFRASIIDVAKGSLTIALIGDETKAMAIQNLLQEFGILELARTGMVALERGRYTIDEDTKEKGEFDYGKNLH